MLRVYVGLKQSTRRWRMNSRAGGFWAAAFGVSILALVGGVCFVATMEAKAGEEAGLSMSGKISAVDPQRNVLIMDRASESGDAVQPMEFVLQDGTEVSREGIRLDRSNLQAGPDVVTVHYATEGSRRLATSIVFESPSTRQAAGTVKTIDPLAGELSIQPKALLIQPELQTFSLTEATVISFEGLRRYLTDIRVGDEVSVDYETKEGKSTARTITIDSRAELSATAPSPPQ
jgi:hypothetical protein